MNALRSKLSTPETYATHSKLLNAFRWRGDATQGSLSTVKSLHEAELRREVVIVRTQTRHPETDTRPEPEVESLDASACPPGEYNKGELLLC